MRLFRSRNRSSPASDEAANYREPIRGSRKVSWDRNDRGQQPKDLLAPSTGPLTDPTLSHGRSHSRKISGSNTRRSSYQTDTTSRSIDPEARSIRVRKSDMFRSKPLLKYQQPADYTRTPQGYLPTLHKMPQTAFVDDMADELNTHELRSVMETDLRRKKRRQSAIEEAKSKKMQLSSSTTPRLRASGPAFLASEDAMRRNHSSQGRMLMQTPESIQLSGSMFGTPGDWHDPDTVPRIPSGFTQPGIILAGNRESFPDFAVVDQTNDPRVSIGSGRLSNAWTSLWRRASTARIKKENDVAQHRTTTLQGLALQPAPPEESLSSSGLSGRLPLASAPILREAPRDDIPQPATIEVLTATAARQPAILDDAYHDEEIPIDAFYDPTAIMRPISSRATHSRNFSRPTNDSRLSYHLVTTDPPHHRSTRNDTQGNAFSPLLNGEAFPKPEDRSIPNSEGFLTINHFDESQKRQNVHLGSQALSPALMPSSQTTANGSTQQRNTGHVRNVSPTLPGASGGSVEDHQEHNDTEIDDSTLPTTATNKLERPVLSRSITHASIQSLQSIDSQGSWLSKRRSELDDVVRRSFSRNLGERSASAGAKLNSLGRPVSSLSRTFSGPLESKSESSIRASWFQTADRDENDDDDETNSLEHSDTSLDIELNDEAEYEQGIWRTGIGKPVQVIASPLRTRHGDGPTIINHSTVETMDRARQGSDNVARDHFSYRGSVTEHSSREVVNRHTRPAAVTQHGSYMTSVNSFHTAENYTPA